MTMEMVIFLIGQSIVIVGAIIAAYVRTRVSIAKLEVGLDNVQEHTKTLKSDHAELYRKVDGISRNLARLEGRSQGAA